MTFPLPAWAVPTAKATTSSTSSDPLTQIKQYDAQIKATQARLDMLKNSLKNLKEPSSKNKSAVASYKRRQAQLSAQIAEAQAKLNNLDAARTKTQNSYYESTGQYEKLLSGEDRDAYLAVNSLFKSYGLGSLAGKIYDYVKNGYSADTISILLQDSNEYKTRFAGNEARKQKGLAVLSPAEYLATEASYQQIMQSAGLPVGFYDQPSDFADWIGKNTSPTEIQSRVDLATQATILANPNYRKALNMIGISDSDLTAYFLDSNKALPYLQKSAATAAIGGEALAQGLTFDKTYAEQLALQGIGQEEARTGYSQIATELQTYQQLGRMYGETWDQRQSEQATFEGSAEALKKKGRLLSQERGAFSGSVGAARAGLGQSGGAR